MYNSSDLRKGLKVEIDKQPWVVSEFDFCKPGKGQALYRCKLKNMLTGVTMDKTYRPNDKIGKAELAEIECVFSYDDGVNYVFSDNKTYDEIYVSHRILADRACFLIENTNCKILLFNQEPIDVTLPIFIEKTVVDTEPGVRGDTATNVQKNARVDNGYEVQVPLFVNTDDVIKIDTRTGEYVERVSKG